MNAWDEHKDAYESGFKDGQRSRDDEVDALTRERDAAIREVGEANRALGALQLRYDELNTELDFLKLKLRTAEMLAEPQDELRDLAQALVRATRRSLQGEATVSVAEEAADEVEEWLEEHKGGC